MLSRVAESLFWIARYMERAENVARLADAGRMMAALPRDLRGGDANEWSSVLIAAGAHETFGPEFERAGQPEAIEHLFFAENNPSSVLNCLNNARENARSIRTALTQDCWEALNSGWRGINSIRDRSFSGSALVDLIDRIKAQSALFRGTVYGTIMQDDGFEFLRMGMAVERVDSTARLLDVKYHVLLPSVSDVGSATDHYQWQSLLRASAGLRAYFFLTGNEVTARGVAEFLILHPRFPRSILLNGRTIGECMDGLQQFYGRKAACHQEVDAFTNGFLNRSVEDIFDYGLHEFLTDVIMRNYALVDAIAASYGFAPVITEEPGIHAG